MVLLCIILGNIKFLKVIKGYGDIMLFIDLLKKVNIDDVIEYLTRNTDGDELEYLEKGYRKLYSYLLNKEVKSTGEVRILVALLKDYLEDEDADYVHVCGYSDKDSTCYAIEFMNWSEWLGSEVVEKSVKVFGETIYVAECLKEMTFIGFEEEDITSEKEELDRRVEEIENGTAELISGDDFFARLSEELGEDYNPSDFKLSEEDKKKIEETCAYNDSVIKALVSE